ncbi:MAG: glutathione S-transferase [Pseudomonadota bacterium]
MHLLYSFRRCPYAMRARMALFYADIPFELHEVDLKNKPAHMLDISPKGTVPVLQLETGQILDESLDIMRWAMAQNDPDGWYRDIPQAEAWIAKNDGAFKKALDRYKYPTRYPNEDCGHARSDCEAFIFALDMLLKDKKHLLGDKISWADIAIFPFVRQCANTDRNWFESLPYKYAQAWLSCYLNLPLFARIMEKSQKNRKY